MKLVYEKKKIAHLTLGCKVNDYDTKAMLHNFTSAGYEIEADFSAYADVYLINTCTVTSLADKKSRQMIRRAKAMNPEAIVVAAGCMSQVSPEQVKEVEGVNIVIGNQNRNRLVELVENYDGAEAVSFVEDIRYEKIFEELEIESMGSKTRGFLKIQEGCNEFCSYCIIPYARGRSRSRELTNILKEANKLVAAGYKELVLTGIHVESYGKDLESPLTLMDVIKSLHQIEGLSRIRLSSIEPRVLTDEFTQALLDLPKVCDHFHLSLQSGTDKILKAMNRKYTTEDFKVGVAKLREVMPHVAVTTDIIVGFPGETLADFEATVCFVEEVGFAQIHIFPYSAKKGTKSYHFEDQVDPQEKNRRVKILKQIEEKQRNLFMKSLMGMEMPILFEKSADDYQEGYSTNYVKVRIQDTVSRHNQIFSVNLSEDNVVGF